MKKAWKKCTAVFAAVMTFALSAACGETKTDVTVYMPDGAPSMAFAAMMKDDKADDGVSYKVVDPKLIKNAVTYKEESDNADLCVLPVTAAAKLLGSGEKYQMLGTVTHGNLYLIAKGDTAYTSENLNGLIGKTVGVLQIAEVPGLTLKSVLAKLELPYQEVTSVENAAADKINLLPLTGAGDMGALPGVETYLLGEPAVTAKVKALQGYTIAGDLQALYGGENGYPQAVLVAKKSLLESRKTWVEDFVDDVAESAAWLETATGAEIVSAVTAHLADKDYQSTLKPAMLQAETVSRCGVYFTSAKACLAEVNAYLTGIGNVDGKTTPPQAAFYCTWDF